MQSVYNFWVDNLQLNFSHIYLDKQITKKKIGQ